MSEAIALRQSMQYAIVDPDRSYHSGRDENGGDPLIFPQRGEDEFLDRVLQLKGGQEQSGQAILPVSRAQSNNVMVEKMKRVPCCAFGL